MPDLGIDVVAELGSDSDGSGYIAVKLSAPQFELNVWIPVADAPKLLEVPNAVWEQRGSLTIGTVAEAPAFWSAREDTISILVGHDDETWDFGLDISRAVFEALVDEVMKLLPSK